MPNEPKDGTYEVSFGEAFRFWLKLGFISFGGPAGQIAIMHKELVEKRRWLGESRFLHALNYCMLLPGPEAQQLAVYIGWLMHKTLGGIVAGVFFVLPSVFILLLLSYIYAAYGHLPAVDGVLTGFKPVVVAIVVEALVKIGKRALKRWVHFALAALAFVAIFFVDIPFPIIVFGAALVGFLGMRFLPAVFEAREGVANRGDVSSETSRPMLADDAVLEHTIPSRSRSIRIAAIGAMLWLLPIAALIAWNGTQNLHVEEYKFFSISALVTFGGAYAVLAYITQAVTTAPYNWITPTQAVDGLALAETTPGPLIMVLQFVGFMAAWNNPVAGMSPLSSAIIGALLTTYATFLPSFLFIFLGAPYIEKLRKSKLLTSSLSGVTAAVVGVILNLALVFGMAVIVDRGTGEINWFSVVLGILAFLALQKLKLDVLLVIIAGGVIGIIYTLLRGAIL
jgi:chromate transporter